MTSSIPWQQRLRTGTEDIQDEVIRWYQQTPHGKAYVPDMIWGTIQTEAYATVILHRVVDFLGVPDDVPAGVAKRMERQQVLYDGKHHYEVLLGEQALYTNVGGPKVMQEQMGRLLHEISLPSLTLGVLPTAAEAAVVPMSGFHMRGDSHVHYELVSSGVDITDPDEVALHDKAFAALSSAAAYGEAAESLIADALAFWERSAAD
ncbi:DNA-binding protein [Streptomyces sp. S3(2020)]|uniref:Scr1 family TA system antitoxin-like transcriptional regulator n=1 Tax=Streptomyces sp. S3(2020) TaxID=2732044 RepID=UPI0014887D85|nr:DNA-binding protein [Streptomyces sp. S3(2020)]